jgi:hypothetical protein
MSGALNPGQSTRTVERWIEAHAWHTRRRIALKSIIAWFFGVGKLEKSLPGKEATWARPRGARDGCMVKVEAQG